jgi:hypothetical protein
MLAPPSADPEALRLEGCPGPFFGAVTQAAADLEAMPPFFLHVQEPPVPAASGPQVDALATHLGEALQVGFTSFGVDLSGCPAGERVELARNLLAPILDYELTLVVRLPVAADAPDPAADVASTLLALRREGIAPDLVLLPGPDELGGGAFALARSISPLITPSGVAWRTLPRAWRERLAELPEVPIRALLGDDALFGLGVGPDGALDAARLEALSYMEASERLEALRCRNTTAFVLKLLETA